MLSVRHFRAQDNQVNGFYFSIGSGQSLAPFALSTTKTKDLMIKTLCLLGFIFTSFQGATAAARICPEPWLGAVDGSKDCALTPLTLDTFGSNKKRKPVTASIRNGYLEASSSAPFKGNILYYQGLGDSMLNHMPLFKSLTEDGFRVIAFDYMGQGGSTGSMNDTRIVEIGELGRIIWDRHARDLENFPKRTIVGWSTGGLAAYLESTIRFDVHKIILIAPGIFPNLLVGEQKLHKGQIDLITLPTLTKQKYGPSIYNPHIDPIKPTSPLKVPAFAADLSTTAYRQQFLGFRSPGTRTLVLLSGIEDTYVDAKKTKKFFEPAVAAGFAKVLQYPGTLHEIDNEVEPMASKARRDILTFLNN